MAGRIQDYVAEFRELDEAAFLARHPYPVLMSEGAAAGSTVAGASEPTRRIEREEVARAKAKTTPIPSTEGQAIVAIKKQVQQHATIVTVGRGEECDVRLAHPLVSKKHAYFTQDDKGWLLSDAESTNGTWVDGTKLDAHKATRLEDGVGLRFGPGLKFRYFSPRAFQEMIAMRARMKSPS